MNYDCPRRVVAYHHFRDVGIWGADVRRYSLGAAIVVIATAGDTVSVKDMTGAAATTNFTVARNGSNIAGSNTDLTFDKNWAEIVLTYVDATVGWSV